MHSVLFSQLIGSILSSSSHLSFCINLPVEHVVVVQAFLLIVEFVTIRLHTADSSFHHPCWLQQLTTTSRIDNHVYIPMLSLLQKLMRTHTHTHTHDVLLVYSMNKINVRVNNLVRSYVYLWSSLLANRLGNHHRVLLLQSLNNPAVLLWSSSCHSIISSQQQGGQWISRQSVCVCVCMVITSSRLGINQEWLPILLVVSGRGKILPVDFQAHDENCNNPYIHQVR